MAGRRGRRRRLRQLLVVQSARRRVRRADRAAVGGDHDRGVRERRRADGPGARRRRVPVRGDRPPDQLRHHRAARQTERAKRAAAACVEHLVVVTGPRAQPTARDVPPGSDTPPERVVGELLEADYLVVGAGAMGMAFVDVLVTETDATAILVDRQVATGRPLDRRLPVRSGSTSRARSTGPTLGPSAPTPSTRSGGTPACTSWPRRPRCAPTTTSCSTSALLPSGRVRFFGSSDYDGDHRFTSNLSGVTTAVAHRPLAWSMPATCTSPIPSTTSAQPTRSLPRCASFRSTTLASVTDRPARYVIVGAGKTGMDACLCSCWPTVSTPMPITLDRAP